AAVQRLGKNREARRNAGDVDPIACLLDDGFGASWLWRRQENSIRRAGDIFFGPENSDIGLDLVVVRRQIVVAQRPVVPHAVTGAGFEIDRGKAQRDPPPMIGAAADDSRAEPAEGRVFGVGVRLAIDLPESIWRQKFIV